MSRKAPKVPASEFGAIQPGPAPQFSSSIAARFGPVRAGDLLNGSQVSMAFEALGDRWSALILREVFLGTNRFEHLLAATGASRAMLTKRLQSLVREGVLHRHPYRLRPIRYEYRLTRMGEELYPTALMYWLWEQEYGGPSNLPAQLVHRNCGATMLPVLVCRHCHETIEISGVRVDVVGEADESPSGAPPHRGRTMASQATQTKRASRATQATEATEASQEARGSQSSPTAPDAAATEVHVIDVIGDRWTSLVQAAAYFGLERYADIQAALSIPTNTLADRLRLLIGAGVFSRVPYQARPVRYSYRLTAKGRALYFSAFTLHQWAERWLLRGRTAPLKLVHRPCGQPATGMVVCSHCREELKLYEVATVVPGASPAPTVPAGG